MNTVTPVTPGTHVTYAEFEADARARGCTEVLERRWDPLTVVATHTHAFAARALVVQGEMWLNVGGEVQHLRPGGRFELEPGVPHDERYGAEGATYWVARR